jgi:hypothetical protein
MAEESPCTSTPKISVCLNVLCIRVLRMLHTHTQRYLYLYHTQRIQYLESVDTDSQLEFCHWINANPAVTRIVHHNEQIGTNYITMCGAV